MSDHEEGGGVPLLENLPSVTPSPSPPPQPSPKGKRKRPTEDFGSEKPDKSKRKRERREMHRTFDEMNLDVENGLNKAYSAMTPALLADALSRATRRFFGSEMSVVELEDLKVPERAILDTSSWELRRDLEGLPSFLENFCEGGQEALVKAGKGLGSPHTIVVAAAGLRAANLTRELRKFQSDEARVIKLFAKHIKMEDAVKYCKRTKSSIGVGTPQRISALLDDGALTAKNLKRIVIDASHIDQKKRGILGMKETHEPLAKLLNREEIHRRYNSATDNIDIIFY